MSEYDALAWCYDALNDEFDFEIYAGFVRQAFGNFCGEQPSLLLDLGCGTGNMTLALAGLGYDMTGVDISAEMLSVARERAEEQAGGGSILWLMQDMRSFELYGTVGGIVSTLDCINHLTGEDDVRRCFALAANYLDSGGLFIFDVNSTYKFEHILAGHDYIIEAEDIYCGWENDYDPQTQLCSCRMSLFERRGAAWRRSNVEVRERMYTGEQLGRMALDAGFDLCGRYAKPDIGAEGIIPPDADRIYYIYKRKKR